MTRGRAETLIVLAKEPRPGRVKTRLQALFSPEEAAQLAAAALEDSLSAVETAEVPHQVVAWDGPGRRWRQRLGDRGHVVVDQPDGDLSTRLAAAFRGAAAADAGRVDGPRCRLLIGMDTPQVTPALLRTSWEGADAVLGLTPDGGFWAIGLAGVDPDLCFSGIPMSTPRTGAAQLNRLVELGLDVKLLPPLRDVDEPADAEAVAYHHPDLGFSVLHRQLLDRRPEQPADRLFDRAYLGGPLRSDGGTEDVLAIDVARWSGAADAVDQLIVSRCEAPVLDLGCGPGRLVRAVTDTGRPALGIDSSAAAVELCQRRGAPALRARVEDPLPAEGRWGTVLLIDGNIGIGGDVSRLLNRCRELVAPGGLIICEVDDRADGHQQADVVLRSSGASSTQMAWSRIGASALAELAAHLDLWVSEQWSAEGRTFVTLRSTGQRSDPGDPAHEDVGRP